MNNNKHLYAIYQRIKKQKCCDEWKLDPKSFYIWYENKVKEQKGLCHYCHLLGDTNKHYKRHFRKGRRGYNLEVDKRDNKEGYSPENCVLACYPCNNAKSDVFSYKEFLKIGAVINKVKRLNQDSL